MRGLQVDSGRGGSRRALKGSGHALALKSSLDASDEHANRLPLLPLRSDVVFPQTVVPLVINRPSGIRLVDDVLIGERLVGLASQLHPEVDEPGMTDLYPTICVGTVLKMLKFPDGSTRIVCQGQTRARLVKVVQTQPYLIGEVEPLEEEIGGRGRAGRQRPSRQSAVPADDRSESADSGGASGRGHEHPRAWAGWLTCWPRACRSRSRSGRFCWARSTSGPGSSGWDSICLASSRCWSFRPRFRSRSARSCRRPSGTTSCDSRSRRSRRNWAKASPIIPRSPSSGSGSSMAGPPEEVLHEAERELERLAGMHPSSAEYSIVRTYLDWMAILPWSKSSRDRLDLRRARKVLDHDHYDLEKIKERILEYLAVRKLKKDMKGPILCFVGPAGHRQDLAGQEHRQGARATSSCGSAWAAFTTRPRSAAIAAPTSPPCPAGSSRASARPATNNPVFMLDEVDKLGADFRGDPSSALLEVLDPEQNSTFRDHYLDVDFDLSKVMFIATANMLETIPSPLLDRMEVLQLPGYSEEEKTLIAQKYIIPKQLDAHGLAAERRDDRREAVQEDHRRLHPRGRPAQPRARDRRDLPQGRPPAAPRASEARSASVRTSLPTCSAPALLPRAGRPDRHSRRRHRAGLDADRRRDPLHRGDRDARQGAARPSPACSASRCARAPRRP